MDFDNAAEEAYVPAGPSLYVLFFIELDTRSKA